MQVLALPLDERIVRFVEVAMEISTLLLYILLSILLGVGIYHGYKFTKAAAKVCRPIRKHGYCKPANSH